MSICVATSHAVLAAPVSQQRCRSSSLRCFTAVVRGQALQQQQAGPRVARAAVVARAAYPRKPQGDGPEEEQGGVYEKDDAFQERVVQVRPDGGWQRLGGSPLRRRHNLPCCWGWAAPDLLIRATCYAASSRNRP